MSRKFKLSNDYYGNDIKIFNKKSIEIDSGLTVLVGCNGSGKTTMLNQIKDQLKKEKIPVLLHSNISFGEKEYKSEAGLCGNFDVIATLMQSSEGENIMLTLGKIARDMGVLVKNNPNAKELWFLFDAIDSGLSVDGIVEIKEEFIPFVTSNNKDKDIYFVISANEYELARGEKCFDVMHGKYKQFKTYDSYRKFILKTREEKDKRYARDEE